jgi:hypothetical protein
MKASVRRCKRAFGVECLLRPRLRILGSYMPQAWPKDIGIIHYCCDFLTCPTTSVGKSHLTWVALVASYSVCTSRSRSYKKVYHQEALLSGSPTMSETITNHTQQGLNQGLHVAHTSTPHSRRPSRRPKPPTRKARRVSPNAKHIHVTYTDAPTKTRIANHTLLGPVWARRSNSVSPTHSRTPTVGLQAVDTLI